MILDGPSSLYHLAVHQLFQVEGFLAVTMVGPEFYWHFSSLVVKLFASLEYLLYYDTSNWKEWTMLVEEVETFFMLREPSLCDCDKLTGDLPFLLPSLTKLIIHRSPQLASSLPRMPVISKLKLSNNDNLIPKVMEFESTSQPRCFTISDAAVDSFSEEGLLHVLKH